MLHPVRLERAVLPLSGHAQAFARSELGQWQQTALLEQSVLVSVHTLWYLCGQGCEVAEPDSPAHTVPAVRWLLLSHAVHLEIEPVIETEIPVSDNSLAHEYEWTQSSPVTLLP